MKPQKILITGANGQIGQVLVKALRNRYGYSNVFATDLRTPPEANGMFRQLDVLDRGRIVQLIQEEGITQVYHLAAILSAKGEENPLFSWKVNMEGLFNVLEAARESESIDRIFYPSSIAVFGPDTPSIHTPQFTVTNPVTSYGVSKAAGENWCQYYVEKYGLDIRSLRYPGIIGYQTMPGGGTTDYAVDIFHKVVREEPFTCFLSADTALPMMYMDDAIRATIELMEAPAEQIKVRTAYNLAGVSFTPNELVQAIQQYYPDFRADYQPDFRQAIADSWPDSIDDSKAQEDWGWKNEYHLNQMVFEMISQLKKKYAPELSN